MADKYPCKMLAILVEIFYPTYITGMKYAITSSSFQQAVVTESISIGHLQNQQLYSLTCANVMDNFLGFFQASLRYILYF